MTDVCYPLCDTIATQGPSKHSHLCGRGIQHAMGTCLRPSSKQAGRMAGRRLSTTEPARGLPSRPRGRLPTTPRNLVLCTGPTGMPTKHTLQLQRTLVQRRYLILAHQLQYLQTQLQQRVLVHPQQQILLRITTRCLRTRRTRVQLPHLTHRQRL